MFGMNVREAYIKVLNNSRLNLPSNFFIEEQWTVIPSIKC